MNHLISIGLFSVLGIYLFVEYLKERKFYRLLTIVPVLFVIFFQTPLAAKLSPIVTYVLVVILVAIGVWIAKLTLADSKSRKK